MVTPVTAKKPPVHVRGARLIKGETPVPVVTTMSKVAMTARAVLTPRSNVRKGNGGELSVF